ncbi:GGDEF domain-containing protein [Rhizobium sp. CG5]|uniref:GGDEF domain-containing protein n=1 Tax=Rhizobium sp. CG5 TaxID=2726076 RepID=UPI00203323B9|nr:GGDEF domain-containing protein [Rhizobium sp. CG5]
MVFSAARIASQTMPAEASATALYLEDPSEPNRLILQQARTALDDEIRSFPQRTVDDPDNAPDLRRMQSAIDALLRQRDSVDTENPSVDSVDNVFKSASQAYLNIVDRVRSNIDDAALLQDLQLLRYLLDINEAGLELTYYGAALLSGKSLDAEQTDALERAIVVDKAGRIQLQQSIDDPRVKALSEFDHSSDGNWLEGAIASIERDTVNSAATPPQTWDRIQEGRTRLWQQTIAALISDIERHGDQLADRARSQLIVLVSIVATLGLLITAIILLAMKGMKLIATIRSEREAMILELRDAAQTDLLTGLYNRRGFQSAASALLHQASANRDWVSAILFDLDHFKRVNDTYGHDAGDVVLRTVAMIARANFRPFDLLVRHGGEEFLALLPGSSAEDAAAVAEGVRQAIENADIKLPDGTTLRVTASFGCAGISAPAHQDLLTELLKRADLALYAAKGSGRNCIVVDAGTASDAENPSFTTA